MSQSVVDLYVHLVWATYLRQPLIVGKREQLVRRCITKEAVEAGCRILAIGGWRITFTCS